MRLHSRPSCLVVAIAELCAVASASSLASGVVGARSGPGYVYLPVHARQNDKLHDALQTRELHEVVVENRELYYAMNISLGEPPQQVTIDIDTGSSELWVNPDCSTASRIEAAQCVKDGSYNPGQSTSSSGPLGRGSVLYGDQSEAFFNYYTDTVAVGGAVVKQQVFGVATASSQLGTGLLGLGPSLRYGFARDKPYPLLLTTMANQGVIKSRAFSLDLREYDADEGSLLLGGVDTGKFIGKLYKLPIVPAADGVRLTIKLDSIGVQLPGSKGNKTYSNSGGVVLLDSGATLAHLPGTVASDLARDLQAVIISNTAWVQCSLRNQTTGGVDFTFGPKVIRVPYHSLIRGDIQPRTRPDLCALGITIADDDTEFTLGDTFLRAAYVVYDWDNAQIHLAQSDNCGVDIVTIGTGPNSVPDVTGKCNGTGTASGRGARTTVVGGATVTVTGSATGSANAAAGLTAESRVGPWLVVGVLSWLALSAMGGAALLV